jgi:hypothetical protein
VILELVAPGGMTEAGAGAWWRAEDQTWQCSPLDHGAAVDCTYSAAEVVAAVVAAVAAAAAVVVVVSVEVGRPEEAPWSHPEVPGSWGLETC